MPNPSSLAMEDQFELQKDREERDQTRIKRVAQELQTYGNVRQQQLALQIEHEARARLRSIREAREA